MKKELIRYAFISILLILVGLFVYPTMYRYDKFDQKIPVRINRVTGKTELLSTQGWMVATSTPTPEPPPIKVVAPIPSPSPTPSTYNGETFQQWYERVIKELPEGQTAPSRTLLFFRFERARLGVYDKLVEPKDYFTLGSTKNEVKKVMGAPDSIDTYFDTWWYESSSVKFENSKVKEYHDSQTKLLVR